VPVNPTPPRPAPPAAATTNPTVRQPAPPVTATATVRSNAPAATTSTNANKDPFDERTLGAQVALARHGFSSGSLDGVNGSQTRAAIRAFQQQQHLPVSGTLNAATLALLATDQPLYTNYTVTAEDIASLQPVGQTWLAKSQQSQLAYETFLELVSERTRSNPKLVRWLNPQMDWTRVEAGSVLKVVNTSAPAPASRAAFLRIHLAERKLHAYDSATNLIAHFPCSIAARVDKRPLGEQLHVAAVAPNPNYTFDPEVFPESAEAQQLGRKLILPPGPNNPVGTAWFSLDKPGYGIHGTPKPEDVGRTESHGCFRLANWNAEHLLKLVTVGTPVFVEP
jgi:lipoprotein-anchoring transpeptidase ErfK/SrfK